MAERGTYLDPQAGLLLETYLLYKYRYFAAPYYTEEGFAAMKGLIRGAPGIHQPRVARSGAEDCLRYGRVGGCARP
jgi:hypothetical protein